MIIGMFPGNASQRKGMFSEQYDNSEIFRQNFDKASDYLGIDLITTARQASNEKLEDIGVNTPIIIAGGYASFQSFCKENDVKPDFLIGHSLGEFSAILCSGMISLENTLELVTLRAKLAKKVMEKYNAGMAVINHLENNRVEKIILSLNANGMDVSISCYNSPSQACISGRIVDLLSVMPIFLQEGATVHMLKGNAPYHTSFMNLVKNEFEDKLDQITIQDPKIPVLSNWFGECYTKENARTLLLNHLIQPIRWERAVKKCIRKNADCFIEFGCGGILTKLMWGINQYVSVYNIDNLADLDALQKNLIQ